MSIADKIIDVFDNQGGTPIKEPVRSALLEGVKNWETIITPEFISHPSKRFKSIARFYRNALAVEASDNEKIDGKLLGCKGFSFYDSAKWRSADENERNYERHYTLENNNNKFSEFSPISISAGFWTNYQISDETVNSSIDLLDTYMNGILYSLKSRVDTHNMKNSDEKTIRYLEEIDRAHNKIFMKTINGREPDIINGVRERTTFKKDVIDAVKDIYMDHMNKKVHNVMGDFQKTLDTDARDVFLGNPGDAKVINYNRFMGFKGGERDIEVGMCLRDVNKYYSWALDFMGDLDGKLASDVIKAKEKISARKLDEQAQDREIKRTMREHIGNAIKKEFGLHPINDNIVVDMIEFCNSGIYSGVESLKELSLDMRNSADSRSLFIDIAKNMSEEIFKLSIDAKGRGVNINEIMSPRRIETFNIFRTLKKNLISMGIPSEEINLPSKLAELDFYINTNLDKNLEQEAYKGNLCLYAHDIMRNIVGVSMGKDRRSLTTGDAIKAVYGDNINLFSLSKSIITNSNLRMNKEHIIVDGKEFMDSDIFDLGDVADVPLPAIGNLRHRYIFSSDGDYIIEFPSTPREFYNHMAQEQNIDGENVLLEVRGDLKKMVPVLGQRIISQNTLGMIPDEKEVKRSFIIKQRAIGDIGYRTVAYVEVPLNSLIKSMSDVKASMSIVDKTVTNPNVVDMAIKHLNTQPNIRVKKEDLKESYRNNRDEIAEKRPSLGYIIPEYRKEGIKYGTIYKWSVDNGVINTNPKYDMNDDQIKKIMIGNMSSIKERAFKANKIEHKKEVRPSKEPASLER